MKNTRIILALILIITTLTSCRSADSDEPVNMEELMKIRTWMVDKDLEGKGFDPRKLLAPGAEAIKATVKEKMELFGSVGKA